MLSDKFIRNAKPGLHSDSEGLYLKVYPTGKRSFVLRTQVDGRDSTRTLGAYPRLSLADARKLRDKEVAGDERPSLEVAVEAYLAVSSKTCKSTVQTRRMFELDVFPVLAGRTVDTINRAEWTKVLQRPLDRGSPVMANTLFSNIKTFLSYCAHRGWADNVLYGATRHYVGGKQKARTRVLDDNEIAEFFELLRRSTRTSAGVKWCLHMELLTGLRSTEVINVNWRGEVLTKMKNIHKVPLTPEVRAMLKRRPTVMPRSHVVVAQMLRTKGATYTPHDLRRTFATKMSDLGVMPHVVEKMLDHKMQGVMAVYNHSEFWPERVAAMKLWGRTLRKLRQKKTPT